MKTQTKTDRVTLNELAKVSGYSRQSITSWTTAGYLQRKNGLYLLAESLEAIKEREKARASEGSHDAGALAGLRRKLLEKKIEKLEHEISVARGLVHNKAACCQSLTAMRAAESRILHTLGDRVALKNPELPGVRDAITTEVDSILARLHDGGAYDVVFTCPHCRQPVDKLVAVEKAANTTNEGGSHTA